jgi:hypothetical protein
MTISHEWTTAKTDAERAAVLAKFRAALDADKATARAKFAADWGGLTPREACEVACENAHLFKPRRKRA